MADTVAPDPDDERHDDLEYDVAAAEREEPGSSRAWLNNLEESEDAFEDWNTHCDNIDKMYANIERLTNMSRNKQYQMLWANAEVLKPSIYAQPPVPVVVTKFKDRRPVPQAASELLERACTVAFDLAHINDLMLLIRDDVALTSRGVPWVRYQSKKDDDSGYYATEKVVIDYKPRRDFLHSISRTWQEVTWVAAASYLTRDEARQRFHPTSGDEYKDADYTVDKDAKDVGGTDDRERAKFWEIWHKPTRRVVWVADGCENVLDESDPEIDFCDFFPCPQPAYGTVQRGSLVPVPDSLQYKDQLDELNDLTARIHALTDALEAKGFYPAGAGEIADAVQTAISIKTPGRLLVPISNWAAFGGSKDIIIWLPIDQIAAVIAQCVQLRRSIIEDIYQIEGVSDIMRGATDPTETLGAQQLKTQYGGTRIRDKQEQLVRLARDLVNLAADVICDKFDDTTIIQMTQTDLPTMKMVTEQVRNMQQQLAGQQQALQMAQQNPQIQQSMQADPNTAQQFQQQAQKMIQDGQDAIAAIAAKPTWEQVIKFLRDNRARAFVLDIETDSTILVDENAEKQRRGEFIGMLAQLLPQLSQMIMTEPGTAEFCGEVLKFAVAPYRAGRSLDGAIDQLVSKMQAKASQPQGDDPQTAQGKIAVQIEQMKIQYQQSRDAQQQQLEAAKLKQKAEHDQARIASDERMKAMDVRGNAQQQQDQAAAAQSKIAQGNIKLMQDRQAHQQDMLAQQQDMRLKQQQGEMTLQQNAADFAQKQQQRNAEAAMRRQRAMMRPPMGVPQR